MAIPTDITFHGFRRSEAVEAAIQRWVTRLETVCDRVVRCDVVVDQPHRSHRQGRDFEIHVRLEIPGTDITLRTRHHDVYVGIADAFRATRRKLLSELETRREFVTPPPPLTV